MKVHKTEKKFGEWILKIGKGKIEKVEFPAECVVCDKQDLINSIFNFDTNSENSKHVILCSTNEDAFQLNNSVIDLLQGEMKDFLSSDSIIDETTETLCIPMETINSFTPSGLPPHKLKLKIGAIVMLLRNLNINRGLCNGTRLIVRKLLFNIIDAEILTGNYRGERVLLPRVDLTSCDDELPFIMKRRQFPIRLAFPMTINKAQGQTFDRVGIDFTKPVFSHGQLYVAISRVGCSAGLKILAPKPVMNIVYPEIL